MSNEIETQRRIAALQSELATTLEQLNARRQRMLRVLVILVVITVGYLGFVYWKLSQVDAPTVVEMVAQQIEPRLTGAGGQFGEALKGQAPKLIGDLEQSFKALPDQLATHGRAALNEKMAKELPQAEEELHKTLYDLVLAAKAKAIENGLNPEDPAAIDKLADMVAPMVHEEATKALDGFYAKYSTSSEGIMAYLGELSANQNLTPRQKLHRELVINTLALLHKQTSGAQAVAAPATN